MGELFSTRFMSKELSAMVSFASYRRVAKVTMTLVAYHIHQ